MEYNTSMTEEKSKQLKKIVVAVVRNSRDKVLIVQRKDKEKGKDDSVLSWQFPGGSVRPNESLKIAVQRECKEESGYEIEAKELISKRAHPQFPVQVYYFECKLKSLRRDEIIDDDIAEFKWLKPEKLREFFTTDFDSYVAKFLGIE